MNENLIKIDQSINRLKRNSHYDVDKYCQSLYHLTSQIEFFYCNLVKEGRDEDHTYFPIYRRPKVHTLAYFNIGRGFPKELHDGHYCYVFKDMGYKMLVIPTTSIKKDSTELDARYEMDIDVIMNNEHVQSRIQLSDLRVVDLQRLDTRKSFVEVLTPQSDIRYFVFSRIFDQK